MVKHLFLNAVILFCSLSIYAQTCEPNDPYDQIVSDFHSTIARRQDGSLVVWGEKKASDGFGNVLTPQVINSTNYPGLTGVPLRGALGSNEMEGGNQQGSQAILLTSTGLFAWGKSGIVIPNLLTTNRTFQKITVAGKADGLPPGVKPSNVKIMTATYFSLAIVTDSGYVWILGNAPELYGNGSTFPTNSWHQVRLAIAPYPFLKSVAHLRISANAVFAVDSSNVWYTWGRRVYKTSVMGSSNRAITIPKSTISTNELPRMIGVTSHFIQDKINPRVYIVYSAYFVLTQAGDLYSVGDGYKGILGNGSTTDQLTWGKVKKSASEDLTKVIFISIQEHDGVRLSACAITADNNLWNWGLDDYSGIPVSTVNYSAYAIIPNGFVFNVDKASYAEKGGHTLVYVKDASANYCYVGHRVNGSMGDGTAADAFELTMNCTNTAAVPLCSLCPATFNNKIPQNQAVCENYPITAFDSKVATLSNNNAVFYQWQSSVIAKDTGFVTITGATNKNYMPAPQTATVWYRRIVKNITPNCPLDSSNVMQVSVNPVPLSPLLLNVQEICAGDSIVLNASAAASLTYNWMGPNQFISSAIKPVIYNADETNAGVYTLSVTDTKNCSSDTTSTTVTINTIDVQFATPPFVCQGRSILLELNNPLPSWTYLWTGPDAFISTNKNPLIPQADADKMGAYIVQVRDELNCTANQTLILSLDVCENTFTIPEGFSPNGDGVNDVFIIRGLSNFPTHSIMIFNRWGQKVFQAAPYNNDWTGTSQYGLVVGIDAGELLPEGTYFYVLDKNNGDVVKGSIYLKR